MLRSVHWSRADGADNVEPIANNMDGLKVSKKKKPEGPFEPLRFFKTCEVYWLNPAAAFVAKFPSAAAKSPAPTTTGAWGLRSCFIDGQGTSPKLRGV